MVVCKQTFMKLFKIVYPSEISKYKMLGLQKQILKIRLQIERILSSYVWLQSECGFNKEL